MLKIDIFDLLKELIKHSLDVTINLPIECTRLLQKLFISPLHESRDVGSHTFFASRLYLSIRCNDGTLEDGTLIIDKIRTK